jgi:hypothetical protein
MSSRYLQDSRNVDLDSTGVGSVTFGPDRPNTRWVITRISVSTATNKREPIARIYKGTINDGTLITSTYSGSHDTDNAIPDGQLWPGEYFTCLWTRGDSNINAIVTFSGTEYVGE